MNHNHPEKSGQQALWFAPLVIVPIAFFVLTPWLKQQNDVISMGITVATAILQIGYAVFLAARFYRQSDEVEIAGQRFATTRGMIIGSFAAVLVMTFPPLMSALINLANTIAAGAPDKAIKLGITIGFMLTVFLQMLGMIAVSIWWRRRIIGSQE